jgi:hypothetical protein
MMKRPRNCRGFRTVCKTLLILTVIAINMTMYATTADASLTVVRRPSVHARETGTNMPIPSASVYFDSTFMGLTDVKGELTALNTTMGVHILSISKGGYSTYNATIDVGPSQSTYVAYMTQAGPSQQPSYTVFIDQADGRTKAKNSATGSIDYFGTNSAAIVQSAINALARTGGTILLTAGTYVWQSVPSFPRNVPSWLKVMGDGVVNIRLTMNGPRAFDFHKISDYDTFQNIWIENLLIDCNYVGGENHVVLGTDQNGIIQTRINIQDIVIQNTRTINVPVDPTEKNHRLNIFLFVAHPSAGEPQTYIKNIRIENCDFEGGNYGIGIGAHGSSDHKGRNVFIDNVYIRNVRHSLLSVQTSQFSSANFHIGSWGYGGHVCIKDSYGEYSGDVGVEIDALDASVENVTIKDAGSAGFYHTNFNNPQSGSNQVVTFKNCFALKTSLPSSRPGWGWCLSTEGGIALGSVILSGSTFSSTTASSLIAGEAVRVSSGISLKALTIDGFKSVMSGIDYAAAGDSRVNPIAVLMNVVGSTPDVTLKNIELIVRGSRQQNAGRLFIKGIYLVGNMHLDADGIAVDFSVSNGTPAGMTGMEIGTEPTSLSGTIRNFVVRQMAGGSYPHGITVRGTDTLTIIGQLLIDTCDFIAIGSGAPIYFDTPLNNGNVYLSNILQ